MNLKLVTIKPIPTQVIGAPKDVLFHCLPFDGIVYNLSISGGRKKESITCFLHHADGVDIQATMGLKSPHVYYQHRPSTTSLHCQLPSHLFDRNLDILRANTYKSERSPTPKPPPDNNHTLITTKSELHKYFRVNFGGDR